MPTTPLSDGASRLVFPLDVPDLATARDWVGRLGGRVGVFKVGLELFAAHGPAAVAIVHDAGADCFLDLKLHDIPATMAGAVRAAAALGVRYLTVHASAGADALERAVVAVDDAGATGHLTLLGVTVLTSLDGPALDGIGIAGPPEAAVSRLGHLARGAGIPGLVCSPLEVAGLRATLGDRVTLVVPGVRPAGADDGDQRRTATPAAAVRAGADLLVVGRPIRNADDPVAAAAAIARTIDDAVRERPTRNG